MPDGNRTLLPTVKILRPTNRSIYQYGIAFIVGGLSRGKLASLNGAKGFFAKGGINLLEDLTAELINTAYEGDFNERNFSYNIISFILNDMGKYLMKKIKNN